MFSVTFKLSFRIHVLSNPLWILSLPLEVISLFFFLPHLSRPTSNQSCVCVRREFPNFPGSQSCVCVRREFPNFPGSQSSVCVSQECRIPEFPGICLSHLLTHETVLNHSHLFGNNLHVYYAQQLSCKIPFHGKGWFGHTQVLTRAGLTSLSWAQKLPILGPTDKWTNFPNTSRLRKQCAWTLVFVHEAMNHFLHEESCTIDLNNAMHAEPLLSSAHKSGHSVATIPFLQLQGSKVRSLLQVGNKKGSNGLGGTRVSELMSEQFEFSYWF